jgi:hypothetical protein
MVSRFWVLCAAEGKLLEPLKSGEAHDNTGFHRSFRDASRIPDAKLQAWESESGGS